MFYLAIRYDMSGAEQLRVDLKQAHRNFLASLGKGLLTGGAIFDDDGKIIGGSITFEAENMTHARAIVESDPYAQHPEICKSTIVFPFRVRWHNGVFYDGDGFSITSEGERQGSACERVKTDAAK